MNDKFENEDFDFDNKDFSEGLDYRGQSIKDDAKDTQFMTGREKSVYRKTKYKEYIQNSKKQKRTVKESIPVSAKFGLFFQVIAIIVTVLTLVSALSIFAVVFVWLAIIVIILGTFFLILLNEGFRNFISGAGDFANFVESVYELVPYFSIASTAVSALSLLLIIFNKTKGNKRLKRLKITSIILTVINLVILGVVFLVLKDKAV